MKPNNRPKRGAGKKIMMPRENMFVVAANPIFPIPRSIHTSKISTANKYKNLDVDDELDGQESKER